MHERQREDLTGLAGREVVDVGGSSVGYVDLVFVDRETGAPEWIGVWRGHPSGQPRVLAPLRGIEVGGEVLALPWTEDVVLAAPSYDEEDDRGILSDDPDGIAISPEKEQAAYLHYGLEPPSRSGERVVRLRAVEASARAGEL